MRDPGETAGSIGQCILSGAQPCHGPPLGTLPDRDLRNDPHVIGPARANLSAPWMTPEFDWHRRLVWRSFQDVGGQGPVVGRVAFLSLIEQPPLDEDPLLCHDSHGSGRRAGREVSHVCEIQEDIAGEGASGQALDSHSVSSTKVALGCGVEVLGVAIDLHDDRWAVCRQDPGPAPSNWAAWMKALSTDGIR